MCGRYVISLTLDQLSNLFEIPDSINGRINLAANWNAAPTQALPIVRRGKEGDMRLSQVRWGLVPFWSKTGPDSSKPLINARAETAAEKPTFRQALKRRRALIPADGFYEWAKTEEGKQPWFITRTDGAPLVFAGLWERWGEGEEAVDSFAILTAAANADISHLHHRCPVMIAREGFADWLDPDTDPQPFLAPPADGTLTARPVSTRVNKVSENDESLLNPL
ncbi:MAG: SOS response-associated peptidase [Oceanicaulis sp.]